MFARSFLRKPRNNRIRQNRSQHYSPINGGIKVRACALSIGGHKEEKHRRSAKEIGTEFPWKTICRVKEGDSNGIKEMVGLGNNATPRRPLRPDGNIFV